MWDQVNETFQRAARRLNDNLNDFLPGLVVLLVVLFATFLVALVVRAVLARALQKVEFDRRAESLGLPTLLGSSPAGGWSTLVARVVMWAILLMGVLAGITALDAAMPTEFAVSVFRYLPQVLAALVIIVVGNLLARYLARSVLIGAVNLHIQSARLLSAGVKWLVLVLAWTMALEHLRLGGQVMLLAFAILFGGIVLALALAVGLGSKDMVSRSLERQMGDAGERPDKLTHV
jgi:hypothetical protein